jgi:hypothetical protein
MGVVVTGVMVYRNVYRGESMYSGESVNVRTYESMYSGEGPVVHVHVSFTQLTRAFHQE